MMRELQQLGWKWRNNGIEIFVKVDGQGIRVFVPLSRVWLTFANEFAAIGAPFESAIGADFTVGGLFKRIGRRVKKFGRRAKSAIKKSTKKISRVAKKVGRGALKVARYPIIRHGLKAASMAVPVLAPAAGGLEAAHQALNAYERGKRAARDIKRGIKTVSNRRALRTAHNVRRATARLSKRARRGDRRAQQWLGALKTARAASLRF